MADDAKAERDRDEPAHQPASDNRAASRFELPVDGQMAFLSYRRTQTTLTLAHTEVPQNLRGHGLGGILVEFALERGHAEGLEVIVECPFARAYLRKHSGC